jgi:alkylation response protein AidB-like acyl-CoA dehydrogenase
VDVSFTAEQEELRAQARAYLAAQSAPAWDELAALGWTGVSLPEDVGGAGLGFVEEGILHEEMGRALARTPFRATAILAPFLPADEQERVAAGTASWTLALSPLVQGLESVTNVAVVGGDGIYELVGAERELLETTDESRPLGVVVGGEAGRRLAGSDVLPAIRTRSLASLALEACGVATAALELAVAHAAGREQFGRPIGAYQAVAHPLATSYTELELARSLALWAAWCVAEDDPEAALAAASAKAFAGDAAAAACERSIQAHGGIGFTWEHPLHRLYKRALGIQSWEAPAAQLRAEIASTLLDDPDAGGA